MKYILNETPVKTTNGFNINNIKLDLDLPTEYSFHEYEIDNICECEVSSEIKKTYSSRIGLEHDAYKNLTITIDSNKVLEKLVKIKYAFNNSDNLIDNIELSAKENSKANIFINYFSVNNLINFHNGNININALDNSELNITILNNLNSKSINMLSSTINVSNSAKVKFTLIDLSGNVRLYNFESHTYKNGESTLNNIYVGKNNEIIDLNYNYINEETNSKNVIEVQGALSDFSKKAFKGIIDFKENTSKSIGKENENVMLLSDNVISRSLPMLLCHEEDVDGSHSVSSGKIDQNRLFYLMSRGISLKDAEKLIIKSNFNKIISEIPNDICEEIETIIDKII